MALIVLAIKNLKHKPKLYRDDNNKLRLLDGSCLYPATSLYNG